MAGPAAPADHTDLGAVVFFVYLARELRRRARQATFIALGLAVAVGLVLSVTAASAGVKSAQGKVLQSLYGVGTDITVTRAPTQAQGGPLGFGVRSGNGDQQRPKAGTTFTRDNLTSGPQLGALKASSVTQVRSVQGVADAVGALTLTDVRVSGKLPNAQSFSNGQNGSQGSGAGPPTSSNGSGSTQSFRSSFKVSSFTVTGVDPAHTSLGTLSSTSLAKGRSLRSTDTHADVAVVTSDYAKQHDLKVGSTISVASKKFTVVGTVTAPRGSSPTDVYIPLARAQALSGLTGKVNTVYVSATKNTAVDAVAARIKNAVPSATVTTSSDLAGQVSGSLSSAASLANNLGKWLSIAVLIAAFLLASLLTLSAVSRRVRELGTLKALGWSSRRVVAQVVGESLVIGAAGAALGVALGYAGASVVNAVAPALTATSGGSANTGPTGGGPGGPPGGAAAGPFGNAASAAHTVTVHLSAAIDGRAVLLAVLLAVTGGLLAGAVGGWRAARLRPAAALARIA
ncbi:MAG: hypothetical protein QOE01_2909 [Actinomycetota bacterium]|nr:hypothetical protein [Actinomycetota bacterium]